MKSQAQMSILDGVLSIGIPTLSVLSGVLAHSVRVISESLTGLENAMMMSVEVLSAAVMLWWALGVILGVGYLLKVRAGSIRLHHREDRGTFLLPRYIRNTILTLGGAALGLSAAFAPAQATDAHPDITQPCNICAVSAFSFPCCPPDSVFTRSICRKFYAQHGSGCFTAGVSCRNPSRGIVSELSILPGSCLISAGYPCLHPT